MIHGPGRNAPVGLSIGLDRPQAVVIAIFDVDGPILADDGRRMIKIWRRSRPKVGAFGRNRVKAIAGDVDRSIRTQGGGLSGTICQIKCPFLSAVRSEGEQRATAAGKVDDPIGPDDRG
jgi:hypothetical protein